MFGAGEWPTVWCSAVEWVCRDQLKNASATGVYLVSLFSTRNTRWDTYLISTNPSTLHFILSCFTKKQHMSYPAKFTPFADKQKLVDAFVGKKKADLSTPALIVDRSIFTANAEKMLAASNKLGINFRAHVKTHKTLEGTKLQLGSKDVKTDRIVVSTLGEAWGLVPLMEEGLIKDVLFSLPVVKSRLSELVDLSTRVENLRLMLDNYKQIETLVEFSKTTNYSKKWSIFVKINMGTNRAGILNTDEELDKIIEAAHKHSDYISLYGFYCHAGHAYSSCNCDQAQNYLIDEINHGNIACQKALAKIPQLKDLVISVGSTPTAHTADWLEVSKISSLAGNLELHAGNYPFCDLQQVGTGCAKIENVSCRILADVISSYPGRGSKQPGEELINAGVIALARESGPIPGYGRVYSPAGYENWIVGRLSQEHGILTPLDEKVETELIPVDTRVEIIPQHSCIAAAGFPWYYIFDGDDTVVDIWIPYRGW